MSELTNYQTMLSEAINARRQGLEKSEVVKLKETLRTFQSAYTSLYGLLLKKGLIKEDPYKGEAKVGEIIIPESASFSESDGEKQLSIRLASLDTQLDFLVNFYQFSLDFFTLERIKQILGLIKCIDWVHLSAGSQFPNTAAVGSLVNRLRSGNDAIGVNIVNNITVNLSKFTISALSDLKVLTDFNRQAYKLELRTILSLPKGTDPSLGDIKKAFTAAHPGQPFYAELAEELLQEDYSPEGPALREQVLKSLGALAEDKPKTPKQEVSLKPLLIEGVQALGSLAATLTQIGTKFDENELLLKNRKISFWDKVKRLLDQILNKEPEPSIYEIEYNDGPQGELSLKERVNFNNFRTDLDKKAKNLANLSSRDSGVIEKLEALPEDQLVSFLERAIKEIRIFHRLTTALDDYFKNTVDPEDRNRVKGIKPELATIKNAFIRAHEKIQDYTNQKEEEAQLKPAAAPLVG